MCLGGGGGYAPAPVRKPREENWGQPSGPEMINDEIVGPANDPKAEEAARNDMDPPKKTKLKVQSDKNTGLY